MKLHLPNLINAVLNAKIIILFEKVIRLNKSLIQKAISLGLLSYLLVGCNLGYKENKSDLSTLNNISVNSSEVYAASEELLNWLESRVDLLVKHKANCRDMALALLEDQKKHAQQLKHWRTLQAGTVLSQRASSNTEFSRKLNQIILKGDLVHSYCAYQSDFRDLLKRLR